ncbi:MAG TPA: bifunctional YncE family protein/alkaline phosphatase family protein [Saprospiraceae bacterium]|nr:bifunctional YncE family protein/alkaline phosphatase family protein [Saprospiraceae bacterium]HNT21357.1 bifunctional YncE family protein/alkaline phosphatase family protein [Saprospiraceae bacterium]
MKPFIYIGLLLLFLCFACRNKSADQIWVSSAPAGNEYCFINEREAILPNGRYVRPMGKTVRIAPHPYGLVLSADGRLAVTANSGTNPFSITVLRNPFTDSMTTLQIPKSANTDDDLLSAVFMGLAISPDDKTIYVAGGQTTKIFAFDALSGEKKSTISCTSDQDGFRYNDGYIGDMIMTRDGKTLYAVDQTGFRVIEVNLETGNVVRNWRTGRYPFGICLSPDEKKMYVANVGMFEYSLVNNMDSNSVGLRPLDFPAFAYGSEEMVKGIDRDSIQVKGLGEMNADEAFSIWVFDLESPQSAPKARIKTGFRVGEKLDGIPAVGGSSPNSIVTDGQYVYVSNGSHDCISVIDAARDSLVKSIDLTLDDRLGPMKGIIPFGLSLDPERKKLYVAESGINAVGVIDLNTLSLQGHLPVGWFPSKLRVSPDGKKLLVANAKGFGSGPNGGPSYTSGPEGDYIGSLMKGSVTILDIPSEAELSKFTGEVIANNFSWKPLDKKSMGPVPPHPASGIPSPIKHIVFVSKENRTYDEVFGQIKNGKGEPSMARYGHRVSFYNKKRTDSVINTTVMPNHLALAQRFAISDNFYVDSDHSADGHRWLAGTYPNEWLETHTSAAYGGKRDLNHRSNAPGRFGMTGASGAIYPEEYNPHGSIWDHLHRNGKEFFNFGFGVEFDAGSFADPSMKYGGVKYLVNYPLPGPLYDRTSRRYATYNMAIPDQFRLDVFIEEFNEKWGDGKSLPQVITIILPNDHGAGDRPEAGFPFRESYMSDNDLALGRLVEFLSHTPYWKEMAIVITEDDSQDGRDHIDAHRSILMVVSPYAKKNYVSHTHYSFGSIFKTFWNILGIPYLNQYDAGATDLAECFTTQPDFSPYQATMVDTLVFNPRKALTPLNEEFDWKALGTGPKLDDETFIRTSIQEYLK